LTARLIGRLGCRVVAVSDVGGGVHRGDGLDVQAVFDHLRDTGSVVEAPDTDPVSNQELLELDVDVLIPAALDRVVTERNAGRVKAGIVVEAANHPLTPAADAVLTDRGVTIVPDILANAGGVTVSYFAASSGLCGWSQGQIPLLTWANGLRRTFTSCAHEPGRAHGEGVVVLLPPLLGCRIGKPRWRGQARSPAGGPKPWSGPQGGLEGDMRRPRLAGLEGRRFHLVSRPLRFPPPPRSTHRKVRRTGFGPSWPPKVAARPFVQFVPSCLGAIPRRS
jgi:Glutamate/Leucine/Phenylalanine/Valine dehydrogenase